MIWLFMVALVAIAAIFLGARRRVALALAFLLLVGVFAVFVSMQWGNEGLGL
ncbi:MAG: hypothetical protein WC005_10430 [Candidatus Nanopelagicales bacterium]